MNRKFNRKVIFSKTPLTTAFRFGDIFQIYPCDFLNAPQSDHCSDIPLVIDYWYDLDENPEVDSEYDSIKEFASEGVNQINRLKRITNILTAVTNHRFFDYTSTSTKWGIVMPEQDELEKIIASSEPWENPSRVFLPRYEYSNLAKDKVLTEFAPIRHQHTQLVKHIDYYLNDPIESRDKVITLPQTIHDLLTKYFSIEKKQRTIIDTVAHLICNGIDLEKEMKSLSFLSFVSSIESLVNFEYKDKKDDIEFECNDCQAIKNSPIKCPKCGRPIWGVKAKFKTFLKTYVAKSEDSIAKYNRIYNLRSDIVHNGMLLLGDEQLDWKKSKKADSQWMTHLETKQLARLALVNWLLLGPNRPVVA